MRTHLTALAIAAAVAACAPAQRSQAPSPARDTAAAGRAAGVLSEPRADAFPSTYTPVPSRPTVIRNATIMTAAGPTLTNASILLRDGKIVAVGATVDAPADAVIIDGAGKFVTPGLIDTHSHLGVYSAPGGSGLSDGNEATNPNTAHVWAEHSVWPQDPQFPRNLAGGITTLQVLPGSANLFGGRGVTLKVVPSRTVQGMKFPGAKHGLKMACGENPKRVYGGRGGPSTRMGNVAGYRSAWIDASAYRQRWDKWLEKREGDPPERNLRNETLAEVLRGNILVHNHCYGAHEMAWMIDIAKEFGYQIRSFHHGVEAYKVADLLAKEGISASIWADWGGFKIEAMDAIKANLAIVHKAGARAIVHSDDASGSQRLNQEAAKGIAAGQLAGITVSQDEALKWITINPAWALGIEDRVGTLEAGKNADVVLWTGNPFSTYSKPEKVWVDGAVLFDLNDPQERWRTDFELGFVPDTRGGTR